MTFQLVRQRISEVESALAAMRSAANISELNAHFGTFVSKFRSVTFSLQQEGRTMFVDFDRAYAPYQAEMSADPLLVALKNARNAYEKKGAVGFMIARGEDVFIESLGDRTFVYDFRFGACFVEGAGTPDERLIPVSTARVEGAIVQGGTVRFLYAAASHRGQSLATVSAFDQLELAVRYLREMVHGLRVHLSGNAES